MPEPITPAISDRICKHMNEDHGDALVLYAKVYGHTPDAETARMISIDPAGMDLAVDKAGETISVRILFEHTLESAQDAHHTLIDMIKATKQ
jgi:putative heme iron utilization protein